MIPDDGRPVRGPVPATGDPVPLVPSRPWMKRGLIRAPPVDGARDSDPAHADARPAAPATSRPSSTR